MGTINADFLICGSGIIGLTIARELIKRGCENIVIIEKEDSLGKHASGRNSGVLHAGIYYSPDSLRAKSCLNGNLLMKQYCKEKNLPLLETGKVIVTRNEKEIETLKELYNRALKNGAKAELIDEKQLHEIEPNAKTYQTALYSYYTAIIDPKAILNSLRADLESSKVGILTNTEFKGIKESSTALTSCNSIKFKRFINASGAYSDKIAHLFDVGLNYKLLPFKGTYKKLSDKKTSLIRGNIYPVPDIKNPFLGVHFTKSIKGDVYAGPTAIPAFGRENYGLLSGIGIESIDILLREAMLFLTSRNFRNTALAESKKYLPKSFFEDAKSLLKGLNPEDIVPCDKVGIRPQLIDWKKKELVMDFIILKDSDSVHILNTISPGFTSSMDFAAFVADKYILI